MVNFQIIALENEGVLKLFFCAEIQLNSFNSIDLVNFSNSVGAL